MFGDRCIWRRPVGLRGHSLEEGLVGEEAEPLAATKGQPLGTSLPFAGGGM